VDSAAIGDDSAGMPPFVALFGLGACALAVAVAVLPQMFAPGADADALGGVLATRVLVQLGLLAMAVLIGCRLAPQVALRSHAARLAPRWNRREVGEALLAGVLVGMVVVGVTALLGTPTGDARIAVGPRAVLRLELARAVHLGVFNELVMRWGAMSFLTLVVASARRRRGPPSSSDRLVAAFAAAILETAPFLIPGLLETSLTGAAAVSVLMIHFVPAVVCGWLYGRWSLEAGMIARALPHLLLALAVAGGVVAAR
jgi:hypothetical protein